MPYQLARYKRDGLFALVFLLLVGVLTVVAARSAAVADAVAASPARVVHGRFWLLVTSGLLAERPLGASIVSFVLLAALTLAVCGRRVFWLAALGGHVGSTMIVYATIAATRLFDAQAFANVYWAHDYGVSAVSASWLGALATVAWRSSGNHRAGRIAIALSCLALALFAYRLHPGLTIIASEHVLAFAVGVGTAAVCFEHRRHVARMRAFWLAVAGRSAGRRPVLPGALRRADPIALAAFVTLAVVVGGSVMPTALGALKESLATGNSPSVMRCISAWNRSFAPPLSVVAGSRVLVAPSQSQLLSTRADHAARDLCSYTVMNREGLGTVVAGRVHDGTIANWARPHGIRGPLPTNATVSLDGFVQLDRTRTTQAGCAATGDARAWACSDKR